MWTLLRRIANRWRPLKDRPTTGHEALPFQPVNYLTRDPTEIQTDVEFSIRNAQFIAAIMRDHGIELKGAHFLELGPGPHFGVPLILASMGVRVTLADRFLARWQEPYHPALYRELHRAWDGPKGAIEAVLDANRYPDGALTLLEEAGEAMVSVPAESVDFTYSNAVLEHVVDMRRVAQELFRVMRDGAIGAHQVDMRYHAEFDRPLEHLVMSEEDFAKETAAHGFERGNRLRPSEFTALFERCGLRVIEFKSNIDVDQAYMSDALHRLRAARSSYRSWPVEDLSSVSGRFYIQRVDGREARDLKQSAERRLSALAQQKRHDW